jgi:thiol-disulfide isomerase/thioredoxin
MPPLESVMQPLGTAMPAFELPDCNGGGRVKSASLAGQPVLVMFLCNHCPYVKHLQAELARLGRDLRGKAISIVAISSNDPATYPEDAPERMTEQAKAAGYSFPYCFDATQQVARDFGAACTPDFFLFDAKHRLAYRGRLDASRPRSDEPVNGADLRAAIDAVMAGRAPSATQHPSIGCSIKWKA